MKKAFEIMKNALLTIITIILILSFILSTIQIIISMAINAGDSLIVMERCWLSFLVGGFSGSQLIGWTINSCWWEIEDAFIETLNLFKHLFKLKKKRYKIIIYYKPIDTTLFEDFRYTPCLEVYIYAKNKKQAIEKAKAQYPFALKIEVIYDK